MNRFAAQQSQKALSTNVCLPEFPGPEIVQTQGNRRGLEPVSTLLTLPPVLLAVSLQDWTVNIHQSTPPQPHFPSLHCLWCFSILELMGRGGIDYVFLLQPKAGLDSPGQPCLSE